MESCITLNRVFRRLGHQAEVLTGERGDESWVKNLPFTTHFAGPTHLGHYAYSSRFISLLWRLKSRFDGIVVHGIWQYHCTAILAAIGKSNDPPFCVFAHGNLDSYFIQNFPVKHIKKSIHYRLIEAPLFRRARAVLFTCNEERRLASAGYKPCVGNRQVVRYGIDPPPFDPGRYEGQYLAVKRELEGKDLLLFFGRIHPKKGCDLLLKAFAATAHLNERAHLLMVGPDEIGWVDRLQQFAKDLGIADRISWLGPAYRDDKWFLFSIADVFILPSHMENFGIAITEAMSCGVPVLISDKINIYPDIAMAGAGFSDADDLPGTTRLLTKWFGLSKAEHRQMRQKAQELVRDRFLAIHAAHDIINIFMSGQSCAVNHGNEGLTAPDRAPWPGEACHG